MASLRRLAKRAAMTLRLRADNWRAGSPTARWCGSGRNFQRRRALRRKSNDAESKTPSRISLIGADRGLERMQSHSRALRASDAHVQEGARAGSGGEYAAGARVHEARQAGNGTRMHRQGIEPGFPESVLSGNRRLGVLAR